MGNIFFGLNIGRSALLAHQAAIDVTGHNLSNVQTEGYSRQRVSLVQSLPIQTPQGPMGSGVSMDRIQRVQLAYLERQINQVQSQHGYDETLITGLEELQATFGEPSSDGLGAALTEFWNAWEALSVRPGDAALRAQALDRAEHLAATYNGKITGLVEVEERFEEQLLSHVSDVNALAEQIADLNGSIAKSEAAGYRANDLRDQRDVLVRQLTEKLGLETETDGSYLNLRFPDNGPYLVHMARVTDDLSVTTDTAGRLTGFQLGPAPIEPKGGAMGALVELRDEISPDLRGQLSNLMATVADRVNSLHTAGYDRDGEAGLNLFVWSGGGSSATFATGSELQQVAPDADLEPGTHYLEVASVDAALTANEYGDLPTSGAGSIELTAAGAYAGPKALNVDYHVRVLSGNSAPGSLDGMRVRLYRGDEPVGAALDLSGAPPYEWTGVDGFTFTATVTAGASFSAGQRSDGLSTTGTVSLDGGPARPVGIDAANHVTFDAGGENGFTLGKATVDFTLRTFTGASFTVFGAEASLGVNAAIAADTDKLAAGGPPQAGGSPASGNGENARRIANLATEAIFDQVGETPAGQLGLTVRSLGGKARDAKTFEAASGSILAQLDAQRESASGVNMDEEMVQLIQFQRGFEAAARFLSTVDELLETLISRVGAGR